jgi:hypothetical protein
MEFPDTFADVPPHTSNRLVDVPPFGLCRPIDIWDCWRFAQADVDRAFRTWMAAARSARAGLHRVYRAALDREEQACVVLAAVVRAAAAA